ncbi:MAG: potassium transporter TrkG [Candidatus Sumerlaeia bacterium]|nr:potassium transporter TrkG [Candidatus Sumerlaeia bacterium]
MLTIPRLLVVSFGATILFGALLLNHPACWANREAPVTFLEALFTSTSAVCVTGLTVRDTGTAFSTLGIWVVLLLIQAGGLGILTISNLLVLASGRRIGQGGRMILEETTGVMAHTTPATLLREIIGYTLLIEALGATLLTARFAIDHPLPVAAELGIFHSVSAFCNAGFGLFPDNLMSYRGDLLVNSVVMGLIVAGGLGFVVYADLTHLARNWRRTPRPKISLHTRVVMVTTVILIVGGALVMGALEVANPAMGDSFVERLLSPLFLSVTCRTAGFNTVDIGALSNATLLVAILLMAVGGSPGSTAGGLKTTTLALLHMMILSRARNRPHVEIFDRTAPPETVAKALAVTAGYALAVLAGVVALEVIEAPHLSGLDSRSLFLPHLFEVVSALGTVGLSTGITASLQPGSQLVIILCMFLGRLGPLIVAASLVGQAKRLDYTLPREEILVG